MFAKFNLTKSKVLWITSLSLLIIALGGALFFYQIREWRHQELIVETRQALLAQNWKEAKFLLGVLRQRHPQEEVTSKLSGDFFLYQNDPVALAHRRHLAKQFPTPENRLAYGLTLLHFQQWKLADEFLET